MELKPTEFCYNIYINNNDPCKYGIFYIGNGDIFIKGTTYILHGENDKVKLELTFINSSYSYNIDYIVSNSYEQIDIKYYNTIEDAINMKEMIKFWCNYKDYKCNKQFKYTTMFKINDGNLLNKIQYRTSTLVDYIIYNKMLKITEGNDMSYIPNCPILHEKINYVYNKEIFNLSELNFILDI
jgi:hypothetical protein